MSSKINNRKFKGGAYTTVLSLLVIVMILVVNLIVSGVFHSKDLTATGQYSLHQETVDFLKKYDTPVDMYYICEVGQEMKMLQSVAENFAANGNDFTLTYKDPSVYPGFALQYSEKAVGDQINNNSIVLVNHNNPDLYAYVDQDDMITYEISQEDFKTKLISGYCAEAALARALVKVSNAPETVVYVATGHGEELISETGAVNEAVVNLLSLNSYSVKTIDLKTASIPEDCGALLLLGMKNDLTQAESDKIKDYISNGGRVAWFLRILGSERPVQKALLNYYGLTAEEKLLCEGDPNCFGNEDPSSVLSRKNGKTSAWPLGVGISLMKGARDSIKYDPMYLTTGKSYLTNDPKNTAYSEEYEKGPFALSIKVSETFRGNEGMMYVFNTPAFLSDSLISKSSSYANGEIFVSALGDLCNKDSALSIADTAAREEALVMTTQQKRVLLTVLVGVIPGIILLLGIAVFIMRRR